ncbi:MAG TPA: DUF1553 domain-containing protein [Verrucomicrobiales bacterium]|nr:DUF1553 domain-containing protein [Verrucomicrobiales bacterium]
MLRFLPVALIVPLSAAPAADLSFNRDIRPILTENCFQCHGPDPGSRKANMRLDLADHATAKAKSGAVPIVPGKPDESEFIKRIFATDPDEAMPPAETHKVLKPGQKELLRRWISQGAKYEGHWAFSKPVRPAVPPSSFAHPIDAFIDARLKESGLALSPPADKHILARRTSLDLTGLPPAPEDLAAFIKDDAPDAFDRYVDKLLASPHYGERWARLWMDIARYADSAGYGSDPLRLNMWPWRDWVISAFNRNLPWDQFSRDQLAGDLIEKGTLEQKVATGFHRNTMTNTEGGTDDEEWRVAAVKDRAAVTAQAWMGLTMGCAQCHSHKFDPISQEEYYRFYALFNQTEDNDQPNEQPTLPVPNAEERAKMEALNQEIAALEKTLQETPPELGKELAVWEQQQARILEWNTPDVVTFNDGDAKATEWEKQYDGSILIKKAGDKATFHLTADTPLRKITGLRLEVLPHDSLPSHGPGRSGNGNAVISEISLSAISTDESPQVRYVRVELPGKQKYLHLAEVQVFTGKDNIATSGKAKQSSTDLGADAWRAIDGETNGEFEKNSVTHTKGERDPWWEVDLQKPRAVGRIVVWNRKEAAERLTNWRIVALDDKHQPVWKREIKDAPAPSFETAVDAGKTATFARASATFSQDGWTSAMAIDGKPATGWAWGPQPGVAHTAIFQLAQPLELGGAPMRLRLSLAQNFGQSHVLGHFKISVARAEPPFDILPDKINAILALAADSRTPEQRKTLLDFYRPLSTFLAGTNAKIAEKKKALAAVNPVAVPVMRELPKNRQRKTRFLNKGNFLDPGAEVQPGFPVAFGAPPAGAPLNRTGVVEWIFSPDNPLTARVTVNRFWAQLFGTGLVETEEDFGMQGTYPSHPALLDWLAVEFRENGWDVKRLLKRIVTSATYRQSSAVVADSTASAVDPNNRLLSRYPRRRLDAEQVRDQALALSGLLSRKIGGPSVYPPQPDGLWKAAFNGERTYSTSKGEDKYRRGLYTIWRRTVPYPSMATFDAPSREACTIRRIPTNTPLQAYVTLNDPVYVEASQALARRVMKEGGADTASRLQFALSLALSRPADPASVTSLTKLYESEFVRCTADPAAARKLATEPLGPLPEGWSPAEAAAWTAVANVLLNLDGVLTKS